MCIIRLKGKEANVTLLAEDSIVEIKNPSDLKSKPFQTIRSLVQT